MSDKEQRELMTPQVKKLVAQLQTKGIKFYENDGEMENVVFENKQGKTFAIAHSLFYRHSGISHHMMPVGKEEYDYVSVSNEQFLNLYIKPFIEYHLK